MKSLTAGSSLGGGNQLEGRDPGSLMDPPGDHLGTTTGKDSSSPWEGSLESQFRI